MKIIIEQIPSTEAQKKARTADLFTFLDLRIYKVAKNS